MPADRAADAALLRRTRLRLVAWSGGLTLLVLVVLGGLAYAAVARSLDARGTELLADRAQDLSRTLGRGGRMPERLGLEFGGAASGTLAMIVRPDGSSLGDDQANVAGLPDPAGVAAARVTGSDVRTARIADIPVRIYSQAVRGIAGTWVVQVVGERGSEEDLLRTLFAVLAIGGLVAVLVAAAVGFVYAGRALVPIRASMTRRDIALERQREFAANASHELRTPLAVIRTSATDLRRTAGSDPDAAQTVADIEASVDHLGSLVDDLLLLARTDSGAIELERMRVDLADVAAEAAGALTPVAAARGVRVLADPRPAEVVGDPLRLRQLVTILVDNALAHSPPGSTVAVRVRPEDRDATLAVEDDGPGIRPEDLPRVFERFWRADDAPAGGTGLGLAIAAWITERHGGTILAENRPEGGARFVARIPLRTAVAG